MTSKHHVGIHFVGDDRHLVTTRNVHQRLQMLARVHGTARIGGIVDDDTASTRIDQRLEPGQIDLPLGLGQQRVMTSLETLL
jgi:hypothetical protein